MKIIGTKIIANFHSVTQTTPNGKLHKYSIMKKILHGNCTSKENTTVSLQTYTLYTLNIMLSKLELKSQFDKYKHVMIGGIRSPLQPYAHGLPFHPNFIPGICLSVSGHACPPPLYRLQR